MGITIKILTILAIIDAPKPLPIANHMSYYVCRKQIYNVTNITINV